MCNWSTDIVLFWIADFDVEQMVEQPINRFVLVKHQEELDDKRQIARLEEFP